MRILHRYVGFFVIGLTLVYSLSGVVLIYRDTDFLKSKILVEKTIESDLEAENLGRALRIKNIKIIKNDEQSIAFKVDQYEGSYNKIDGLAVYSHDELPWVLKKFEQLHKTSSKSSLHWFTTIYGLLLLFLAFSSFWMFRPSVKFFKKGMMVAFSGVVFASVLLTW